MIVHQQRSEKTRVWYDLTVTDLGDGTLTMPAGSCWVGGREYPLAAYHAPIGLGMFRLYVEHTALGADYYLDLTMVGEPVSFGERVGVIPVAWREGPGEVHVLRSVADA